jgi:hypothetical protein
MIKELPGQRSAAGGIRTPNLLIRSQMLYPLSYGCRLQVGDLWVSCVGSGHMGERDT